MNTETEGGGNGRTIKEGREEHLIERGSKEWECVRSTVGWYVWD